MLIQFIYRYLLSSANLIGFVLLTTMISITNAQESSINERVKRVENNLLPGYQLAGEMPRSFSLKNRMEYYNVQGLGVAVVEDGRLEWARFYGMANTKTNQYVNEKTLFQAASISKPITALGVLSLVHSGKIALDQHVNDYLSSWKIGENEFTKDEKVTVRHLLTHTAGLNAHGFSGYDTSEKLPSVVDLLNGKGNSEKVEVVRPPGAYWSYSGGGYVILQLLIEEVTGRPFEEYMKNHVLLPLGMTESTFQQPIDTRLYTNICAAYDRDGKMWSGGWHNYPEKGAGGLWTTATDLAQYCIAIQKVIAGQKSDFLSKNLIEQMLSPGLNNWGLGPLIEGEGMELAFTHDGSNAGFKADLFAYIYQGKAAVFMSNSENGADLGREFMRAVAKEYNWMAKGQTIVERKNIGKDELLQFAGTYRWKERSHYLVEVKLVDGQLQFIAPNENGDTVLNLTPYTNSDFVDLMNEVEVSFTKEKGKVRGLLWSKRWVFDKVK